MMGNMRTEAHGAFFQFSFFMSKSGEKTYEIRKSSMQLWGLLLPAPAGPALRQSRCMN